MRLFSFLILVGFSISAPAFAEDMIEISQGSAPVLNAQTFADAAGFKGHEDEVLAAAEEQLESSPVLDETLRSAMRESVESIVNGRWFDVEVAFLSGIPDVIALCIEGHPVKGLAIEACAGTAILAAAVSANVKYRWDLVVHQTASGKVHQLSAGPGFGSHAIWATSAFGGPSEPTFESMTVDAFGSLEYVYWISKHFGISAQLDIGASYVFYIGGDKDPQLAPTPTGRLTFGLAF